MNEGKKEKKRKNNVIIITGRRKFCEMGRKAEIKIITEINFPMAPKQIKFATLLYLLNKHPYLSTLHEYQ